MGVPYMIIICPTADVLGGCIHMMNSIDYLTQLLHNLRKLSVYGIRSSKKGVFFLLIRSELRKKGNIKIVEILDFIIYGIISFQRESKSKRLIFMDVFLNCITRFYQSILICVRRSNFHVNRFRKMRMYAIWRLAGRDSDSAMIILLCSHLYSLIPCRKAEKSLSVLFAWLAAAANGEIRPLRETLITGYRAWGITCFQGRFNLSPFFHWRI